MSEFCFWNVSKKFEEKSFVVPKYSTKPLQNRLEFLVLVGPIWFDNKPRTTTQLFWLILVASVASYCRPRRYILAHLLSLIAIAFSVAPFAPKKRLQYEGSGLVARRKLMDRRYWWGKRKVWFANKTKEENWGRELTFSGRLVRKLTVSSFARTTRPSLRHFGPRRLFSDERIFSLWSIIKPKRSLSFHKRMTKTDKRLELIK